MNALTPSLPPEPTDRAAWTDAGRAHRLVTRLALLYGGLALILLTTIAAAPASAGWARSLGGVCEGAILIPLAGLLASRPLSAARARFGLPPSVSGVIALRWAPRLARRMRREIDPGLRLGRLARRPQGVIVPALGLCAIATVYSFRPGDGPDASAMTAGAAAIVLGFPLLLAERIMAAMPRAALPEAPGLRALLFVPVAVVPLAGLLEVGAALGLPWTRFGLDALAIYVGLVAAELTVRALANWFLPPPVPQSARAAVGSVAALLLQPGRLAPDGLAAPIRTHLGLDFSRSWALRFARSAALPIGLALGVIAWGLTGVSLIELDKRGIYERFGEPVAVWAPGAHVGLPWPLGRVRRVDLGIVHAVLLGGEPAGDARSPAEAPPPASADRLWDQVHPSEVSYLLASRESDDRQGFQTVSVDLRVLYRIGLDDASALKAAYAVSSPDDLVRAEAGRLLARVFAGTTLPDVLGAGRETMAENLRSQLQAELDRLGSGIELVGMVIEAIHPPPGAAEAYHNVQASEIIANTAISTERGRSLASAARARQQAAELTLTAQGMAAETVGLAEVSARTFKADEDAAQVGGEAFLLERYLANISTALAKSPLVIVDHRLEGADAPAIDLRSFGAPPARQNGDD